MSYPTMQLEDIVALHKSVFDNLTETKHNIFMWTIDKYLIETEQFMNNLGYKRHARIIWDKTTGQATAFTVRFTHEYLLWFYKKGNILMPTSESRGRYADVIRETVKKHSQKPQIAYQMIEDMFPDANKLELFARNERDGWDCWGNEV
jgi:N6-adenosine-specific RNA methylase IME4